MTYLTLEQIKQHLNIDSDYTGDDNYLVALGEVVEAVVEKHIDNSLVSVSDGGELPPPLRHAMLLLIGNYYNTRESIAFVQCSEIPLSYNYLLDLFKNYSNNNLK